MVHVYGFQITNVFDRQIRFAHRYRDISRGWNSRWIYLCSNMMDECIIRARECYWPNWKILSPDRTLYLPRQVSFCPHPNDIWTTVLLWIFNSRLRNRRVSDLFEQDLLYHRASFFGRARIFSKPASLPNRRNRIDKNKGCSPRFLFLFERTRFPRRKLLKVKTVKTRL